MTDVGARQCPLCGASDGSAVAKISFDEIWSRLHEEWGAQFSEAVKRLHTVAPSTQLISCASCQLEYWHPSVAGSPNFYQELTASAEQYYNQQKWEFLEASQYLSSKDRVLDVACGGGAFVRGIAQTVGQAVGIDTNPNLEECEEANLVLVQANVEQFAREQVESFDVVTAFQVIEHLQQVEPFVLSAMACVRPGGLLMLSVPNRHRRTLTKLESFDHPPHHLSRWSEIQLKQLAVRLKATMLDLHFEPLTHGQLNSALRQQELQFVPGFMPGRVQFIKGLSRILTAGPMQKIWQLQKLKRRFALDGHTLLAVMQKSV